MPVAWPVTLQQLLNESGFSFSIGDTLLRSETSVGPQKTRRRMTKSVDKVSGTITITKAQFTTFYYFFDTSLNGGAGTFYFNNPITGVQTEYRFSEPPTFAYLGADFFKIAMSWETIP